MKTLKIYLTATIVAMASSLSMAQDQSTAAVSKAIVPLNAPSHANPEVYTKEALETSMKQNTFRLAVRPHADQHYLVAFTSRKVSEPTTLRMIDENGVVVVSKEFQELVNPIEVTLPENTAKGNYYLMIKGTSESSTARFIVK